MEGVGDASECYLQQVVGEPLWWTEGGGKSAVKMMAGAKVQVSNVKHKIVKGRELMRRVRDGDAPTGHGKAKPPNMEEYCQEFELNMDTSEDKKTPPTCATGSTSGSGSCTTAAEQEPPYIVKEGEFTKRKLEFDELITEEEMRALRGHEGSGRRSSAAGGRRERGRAR